MSLACGGLEHHQRRFGTPVGQRECFDEPETAQIPQDWVISWPIPQDREMRVLCQKGFLKQNEKRHLSSSPPDLQRVRELL